MDILKSHIDLEIVSKEFKELAEAWRATWVPIGNLNWSPPVKVNNRMRRYMTKENIDLEKPSEEAYEKMVAYIVTIMLVARETGADIPHIFQILSVSSGFATTHQRSWIELLEDVIARMALQPRTVDHLEGAEAVASILKLQRGKIGDVTFGVITD